MSTKSIQCAIQLMLIHTQELFVQEDCDYPFQRLYSGIACLYISAKYHDNRDHFQVGFEEFTSNCKLSKAYNLLLQYYELDEESFVWHEGWYHLLEGQILSKVNFRLNL